MARIRSGPRYPNGLSYVGGGCFKFAYTQKLIIGGKNHRCSVLSAWQV
jgi:hypothetical protein